MKTALDTNILSAILAGEPSAQAISDSLDTSRSQGPLVISHIVYAEIFAFPGMNESFLSNFLTVTQVEVDYRIDKPVWTMAGQRFAQYASRRRASMKLGPRRLLPDFIIGAHALLSADRIMTFDITRFKQDFPELLLLTPAIH